MLNVWLATIGSVVAVSLISLVGVTALAWREDRLRQILLWLVALAAGALFGDVFIHLLPEMFAAATDPLPLALGILGGVLAFFALEKFLAWRHEHKVENCVDCEKYHGPIIAPLGHLNLAADGLHNFIDGVIIAASFLTSPAVGLATTLAVILHEIPQEIGDFGVLLHSGFSRGRAILFNLLSASLAILGAIFTLIVGQQVENAAVGLLAFAAGGFIYLAGSDLVPELHKTTDLKKSLGQFAALIIGIGLMTLLGWLE